MDVLRTHPVERLLQRLADVIHRYPAWFIYPQLVLFAVCVVFSVRDLEFKTSRGDLVSENEGYRRRWLELREEFRIQEDIVILVESDDQEKNRQFVERLAARMILETNLLKDIFFKSDLQTMGRKALLFLPEGELQQVHHALRDYGPLVNKFSEVNNLNSLFAEVNAQFRAVNPEQVGDQPLTKSLPALERIVGQLTASLERPGIPPSPGVTTLFSAGQQATGEYLNFGAGRSYLITCTARTEELEDEAIIQLRKLVRATQVEVTGINAGLTGEPVLRHDEMEQAQADTTLASIVSLIAVSAIFIFGYRELGRPLKATACLIVGIGYTTGFATFTVGHLNILTITFVPILIGLAIDFGVHLITRYEEELRLGRTERVSMERALVATGTGICTSGLTIAVAFSAMMLTGFKGIREMGIIAGGGLLVCLVPMLTMLPAMLVGRAGIVTDPPTIRPRLFRRERLEQLWLRRPVTTVTLGVIFTLIGLMQLSRVPFDYNLLNLQSQNLPAVVNVKKIAKSSPRSILCAIASASSIPEALEKEKRFLQLPTVASVDSVAKLVSQDQSQKLDLVTHIKAEAAKIQFRRMDPETINLPTFGRTLELFHDTLNGAMFVLTGPARQQLREEVGLLRDSVARLRATITAQSPETAVSKLTMFQRALFTDLDTTLAAIRNQDDTESLRPEDLPAGLRSRFIGRTGQYLLQIYPKADVWERVNQKPFVSDLRSVDPEVAGSPVQFFEYTNSLKRSFQKSAGYALVAITLMLLLHFRNAAGALLILMPVFVGISWMFIFMAKGELTFNPANIISITLLLGIGVTNGIHIMNRFLEEKHPTILGKSTGKAVVVSALTTIAGFGSLVLAKHQGIASLGLSMALGTATCMVAATTVLPAVLILLTRNGWMLSHGWFRHRPPKGEKAGSKK